MASSVTVKTIVDSKKPKGFERVEGMTWKSFMETVLRDELKAAEKKVIIQVDRAPTATESVQNMVNMMEIFKSKDDVKHIALNMKGVGLKCGGVSGNYDLWYLKSTNTFYAIDIRDGNRVFSQPFS